MAQQAASKHAGRRLRFFDVLRGVLVLGMVGFHACYDIVALYGVPLPWFSGAVQVVWRAVVAWSFLFLAGIMCSCSHNNFRRAAKYLIVSALIYVVTLLAAVDTPISFGIIFCIGASVLLEVTLERLGCAPRGIACCIGMLACFVLTQGVPTGMLGVPGTAACLRLPAALYRTEWLSWLGFPGPHFASGDYYPLLPYICMFLAGSAAGRSWAAAGWTTWVRTWGCRPLEFIGRHALEVYILHQPLLLVVLMFVFGH